MKLKKGLELRDVCGEKVVIAQGLENLDFSKMINLNESAAYLWAAVYGRAFEENELTDLLCKEYDVTRAQAEADVRKLVSAWEAEGLLD